MHRIDHVNTSNILVVDDRPQGLAVVDPTTSRGTGEIVGPFRGTLGPVSALCTYWR